MTAATLAKYRSQRAADLLFPLSYERDLKLFLCSDSTLGFGFICRPAVGGDQRMADRLNVMLKDNWPADTLIQFCLIGSPNIQPIITGMREQRLGQRDPLMQEVIEARAKFLTKGVYEPVEKRSRLRVRDIQLVITVKIPISSPMPTGDELRKISEIRSTTEKGLESIGLGPTPMTSQGYLDVMGAILNHGDHASWKRTGNVDIDPDKHLNEQVFDFDTDIQVSRNRLRVGSAHVRTMSIKRFPPAVYFGNAAAYVGDAFDGTRGIRVPFIISASMYFPDQQKIKGTLSKKRQVTNYQAFGPMLKWMPKLAQNKYDFDYLYNALDDGDRPVKIMLNVTLLAQSDEEATAAVASTASYWGELGYNLLPDQHICLPLLLNALPLNAEAKAVDELVRYKTMATSQAVTLLPLFGDWRGTGTPILNLISRNGQVMNLDLYNSGTNYNTCIAAASGSGKSFLSNEIISSYLSVGGQVWVIDVGRSYLKLCELFGGDFLHFGTDSGVCLNPFGIIREYDDEEDMLVGLVTAMAAPRAGLTELQEQELKKAIRACWEVKGRSMNVDDIIEKLKEKKDDQRVLDIATQLYSFSQEGVYGKYFNGENNVNFKNRFTVLELEELKGRKHLQQVVLLQLILQIQSEMYLGERDRRKVVIIDEAWELLTHGDVAKFIEAGYRKFRKYGGSAITITQGVSDLYASPTGRAIVENSANMLLLGQKSEAIEALKRDKRLPLSDAGYELLKTVHTNPGVYSEIFWLTSDYGAGVGRLIVDEFRVLIYSTKPEDVQAINNYVKAGKNVRDACVAVMEDRRRAREPAPVKAAA